jgi:YVTN family beta-propeller protein
LALWSSVAGAEEIWVVNQQTARLDIIDGESLEVVAEVETGVKPHLITMSPDEKRAYVANLRSGDISIVDAVAKRTIRTIPAGRTAHEVDVSPDGRLLLAAIRGEDAITFYDAASLERLRTLPIGKGPAMAVFTPDGRRAYVANGDATVAIVDVGQMAVVARIANVGGWGALLAITPDGERLIVTGAYRTGSGEWTGNTYSIIDTRTATVVAEGTAGQVPHGVAITPDGRWALIANRLSNDLTVVDMAAGRTAGTIADVGDTPSIVAVSHDGRQAFVTLSGPRAAEDPPGRLSGKDAGLAIVDLATRKVIKTLRLGGDPYGVAVRR